MRNTKGFTILEVVVYTGILMIVVTALIGFLLWMVQSNTKTAVLHQVAEAARNAIDEMEKEIREAESLYTPTTSLTQLSLETKKNVPLGETSTYVDFFLCGTRLCVKREGQNAIALTSESLDVTNLQFQEVRTGGVSSLSIIFDVERQNPGNHPEFAASIQARAVVSLRAYE
ncbi:MAG TPA: type II secretion system protein [Candidatus Paceibacterota bacterium]|nr:type II secretion system protein [Candidatus Paceibacterota bacterium]